MQQDQSNIIPFAPRTSREAELWAAYLALVTQLHANLAALNIDTMRACVAAYDAFMAEFTRERP